jgi:hypothetical protein
VRLALGRWANTMLSLCIPSPSSPGSGRVDNQAAPRVLLRLVLVDVEDFEVGGPLDGPGDTE